MWAGSSLRIGKASQEKIVFMGALNYNPVISLKGGIGEEPGMKWRFSEQLYNKQERERERERASGKEIWAGNWLNLKKKKFIFLTSLIKGGAEER